MHKQRMRALPTKEHQKLARSLFLRLIDPGQSEQDTTRRRARLSEFEMPDPVQTQLLRETMNAFLDARLLTSNEQVGIATVEVSHETLIREWSSLITWLHEARQDILLQKKMSEEAEEWRHRGYSNDRLYRGSQLKEAQVWARRNPLSQNEGAFLQASLRRRRQLLLNVVALALVLMISVGGTVWFYVQLRQAQPPDPTLVTTLKDDGIGSLHWAIANAPSGKTITFASDLAGQTITMTNTLLITQKQLHIQGPQRKITLSNAMHGIEVEAGTTIAIANVIITGYRNNNIGLGAPIFSQGNLSLTNSTVSGNVGGGISNGLGNLSLTNSTVSDNTSSVEGGGINNERGIVSLTNSTVSDNTASLGGGISTGDGGIVNLMNSTVSGNTSLSDAGGIVNFNGVDGIGIVNLTNSTVSDNTAKNGRGGGILNIGGNVTLTFCTLYGNHADTGGGLYTDDGTYRSPTAHATSTMLNSLIADNKAFQDPDVAGKFIIKGYNLIQNTTGSVIRDPDQKHHTDLINIPPAEIKIAPSLQLNGSITTKTHALLPGSVAIDAIPPAACLITVNGIPITTDQRGIKRPQGSACDIGAYEYAP